jgi:hypothetical protein
MTGVTKTDAASNVRTAHRRDRLIMWPALLGLTRWR